jgi:hypothetical protein
MTPFQPGDGGIARVKGRPSIGSKSFSISQPAIASLSVSARHTSAGGWG